MRPIILGMNNPHSSDPELALSPTGDPGIAGNRLWNLSGMTETQYRLAFDRRNLLNLRRWSPEEAKRAGAEFFLRLQPETTVVCLGRSVWEAMRLRDGKPLGRVTVADRVFYLVPHPSGRNLWYNDQSNKLKVGRLLRRLAR